MDNKGGDMKTEYAMGRIFKVAETEEEEKGGDTVEINIFTKIDGDLALKFHQLSKNMDRSYANLARVLIRKGLADLNEKGGVISGTNPFED